MSVAAIAEGLSTVRSTIYYEEFDKTQNQPAPMHWIFC